MKSRGLDEVDALIDEALRGDPLQQVPRGFARRVRSRLRVLCLARRERQRLRYSVAAGTALALGLITAVILVAAFPSVQEALLPGIPGALGYCDYFAAAWALSGPQLAALTGLAVAIPLAVTALGILLRFHSGPR